MPSEGSTKLLDLQAAAIPAIQAYLNHLFASQNARDTAGKDLDGQNRRETNLPGTAPQQRRAWSSPCATPEQVWGVEV